MTITNTSQRLTTKRYATDPVDIELGGNHLRGIYLYQKELFDAQPAIIRGFLETQAGLLAEAILDERPRLQFSLPDRVVDLPRSKPGSIKEKEVLTVPSELRAYSVQSWIHRFRRISVLEGFHNKLFQMENSLHRPVAIGAALLRHATAVHMIYNLLPSGRTVQYVALQGEDIPSIPSGKEPESAITARTDAVVERGPLDAERGELQVPFVPAAQGFYLPKWVAFDDQDNMLVSTQGEAEGYVAAMQRFVSILFSAVSLAPYMVSDTEYQQKRYGILGQIINQGRALARWETRRIIHQIQTRVATKDLNQGLSLSLPYFDDQELGMKTLGFEVIPAGRILFISAFVVLAVRDEQMIVTQSTQLSSSTRKHLLAQLKMLEDAFYNENAQ